MSMSSILYPHYLGLQHNLYNKRIVPGGINRNIVLIDTDNVCNINHFVNLVFGERLKTIKNSKKYPFLQI